MTETLFALVVTVCAGIDECREKIIETYDSKSRCEEVIIISELFNAQCLEVQNLERL